MRLLAHLRQFVRKCHCFDVVKFSGAVSNRQGERLIVMSESSQRALFGIAGVPPAMGAKREKDKVNDVQSCARLQALRARRPRSHSKDCPSLPRFVIVASTPLTLFEKSRLSPEGCVAYFRQPIKEGNYG